MKSNHLKLLVTLVAAGVVIVIWSGRLDQEKLTSSEAVVSVVTPTIPVPTPILIDSKTDLKAEANKLTPEDFSEDFKNLRSKYQF